MLKIQYATTYGELPDEYNYGRSDENKSSANGLLGRLFTTDAGEEKRKAEADSIRAKAELDRQIAAKLNSGGMGSGSGMGTGSVIALSLLGLAAVVTTILIIRKKKK